MSVDLFSAPITLTPAAIAVLETAVEMRDASEAVVAHWKQVMRNGERQGSELDRLINASLEAQGAHRRAVLAYWQERKTS